MLTIHIHSPSFFSRLFQGEMSFPLPNKFLMFRGDLLHGVVAGQTSRDIGATTRRLTFLVNFWASVPQPPNCVSCKRERAIRESGKTVWHVRWCYLRDVMWMFHCDSIHLHVHATCTFAGTSALRQSSQSSTLLSFATWIHASKMGWWQETTTETTIDTHGYDRTVSLE